MQTLVASCISIRPLGGISCKMLLSPREREMKKESLWMLDRKGEGQLVNDVRETKFTLFIICYMQKQKGLLNNTGLPSEMLLSPVVVAFQFCFSE